MNDKQNPATLDECFEAAELLQEVAVRDKPPCDLRQIRYAFVDCKLKLQNSIYEPATHKEIDHVTSWNRGVDYCIATLDRLIAEQEAQVWQPIDTAPKDGREVILSLWSGSYATPETSLRWAINGYFKDGFWYSKDPTIGRLADPTHWMPIKPPTMQGE